MATVYDVANAFLLIDNDNDECDGISNLKLQKLVYYAQGFYLALFGEALFDNEIEAWAHGPVTPALYHEYKGFNNNNIEVDVRGDDLDLTQQEFDLIDEVYSVFGQFSAWKLRNLTHEETPWIDHEERAEIIPKIELEGYFRTRINN